MLGDRLFQIPVNVHSAMKNAKNLNSIIVDDQVRNSIMAVQDFANFPIGDGRVSLANPWVFAKQLNFVIDANDDV